MVHNLTAGEKALLTPVFKLMLPYSRILCKVNTDNIGGSGNSITPKGTPYFSVSVYTPDFSTANLAKQWVFVHEMTHVWQFYHGQNVILEAIGLGIQKMGNYGASYAYALTPTSNFGDFNLEQQASIVADYWILTKGGIPQDNLAKAPKLIDYTSTMKDFYTGGPPHRPSLDDYPSTW